MSNRICLILFAALCLSPAAFADTPPSCGGLAGKPCPDGMFCDYPPGSCGAADVEGVCRTPPEMCSTEWQPVIGCNGRQYSNACMAAAAGVSIRHPFSPVREEPQATDGGADLAPSRTLAFAGKVRANGGIEHRTGRWEVVETHRIDSSQVRIRIKFQRPVRNAVILATPYCSFSDHSEAAAAYGYADERTVDFVYRSPCGFVDPSGLDFLVFR